LKCQIIGENLECTLSLPVKFRAHVEGLVGNFNGNPNDDLINLATNQTVPITTTTNTTSLNNDVDVLNACRSCEFILRRIKIYNYENFYSRESNY
jgi:hypothetical protein